jgi:hypothetical protein
MKKTILLCWFLALVSTPMIQAQNTVKPAQQTKVKVYYFHPEERCPIDQSIEANTKNVMQSAFREKIKDGTIDFRIINTDDKANAKLVSGFDINAQALYLVKIVKGKETKLDMTKFAFDYGQSNPLKFKKGLKDEIEKNLK